MCFGLVWILFQCMDNYLNIVCAILNWMLWITLVEWYVVMLLVTCDDMYMIHVMILLLEYDDVQLMDNSHELNGDDMLG